VFIFLKVLKKTTTEGIKITTAIITVNISSFSKVKNSGFTKWSELNRNIITTPASIRYREESEKETIKSHNFKKFLFISILFMVMGVNECISTKYFHKKVFGYPNIYILFN
jgi:hypothetical protein